MKKTIWIVLAMTGISLAKSQTLSNEWVTRTNNTGKAGGAGYVVAADDSGNAITAGRFQGTVDFDPGTGVNNLSSIAAKNLDDIFIMKQNKAGDLIWAVRLGSSWYEYVNSLCVDDSGNVILSGTFRDTVDFDPGTGEFKLIAGIQDQGFVLKLNASAKFVWVKTFSVKHIRVAIDASNQVYLSGEYSGTVDFDPGASVYNITSAGGRDVFVVKLGSTGNLIRAESLGGKGSESFQMLTVDMNDNLVIVGTFNDTADFDPGSGTYNLIPQSSGPMFVCKLNAQGNFIWAVKVGEKGNSGYVSYVPGLAADSKGNIYVSGVFDKTVDFDPGPDSAKFTTPLEDIFLLKLDKNGKYKFAKQFVSSDYWEEVTSLAIDAGDHVYLAGKFKNNIDFDPLGGGYVVIPDSGTLFLTCMDSTGKLYWVKNYGNDFNYSSVRGITTNPAGNVFLTGHFAQTADFVPGPGKFLMTSSNVDIYVLKLRNCFQTHLNLAPKACFSYVSPGKKHLWTKSGVYKDTILSSQGCDSFFSINLTVDTVNVNVTNASPTLTAVESGATYQWVDCNNGYAKINGATNQSYTAGVNGSYAVVINKNGCSDTSSCYQVNNVGFLYHSKSKGAYIYPNPTNGDVILSTGTTGGEIRVKIRNYVGQMMGCFTFNNTGRLTIPMPDSPGIYFLELSGDLNSGSILCVIKN